jgi:hypothetical protein
MALLDIFDEYDRKARILPAVIVLSPGLCTFLIFLPEIRRSSIFLLASGVVSVALVYLAAHVVRFLGASVEQSLWKSWGGAPSTRLVRWRDETLGQRTKAQLHADLESRFGVGLNSEGVEAKDPIGADAVIADAFRHVREYLRLHDAEGLWQKHNVEYGFARNLLGGRWLFSMVALSGAGACYISATLTHGERSTEGLMLNIFMLLIWLPFAWLVLPLMVKHAAERYAERAWLTFGELARENRSTVGEKR